MLALIAFSTCVVACTPDVSFTPRTPGQGSYPSMDRSASRVYKVPSSSCVEIGMVHAEGEKGTLIEQIAREAADNGGTHYIMRTPIEEESLDIAPSGFGHYNARKHVDQNVAAVVYRC